MASQLRRLQDLIAQKSTTYSERADVAVGTCAQLNGEAAAVASEPQAERFSSLRDALQRLGQHEASNIVLVRGVRRLGPSPETLIREVCGRRGRVACVVTYDVRKYTSQVKSRLGDMAFVIMGSMQDVERLVPGKDMMRVGEAVLEVSRFERASNSEQALQ